MTADLLTEIVRQKLIILRSLLIAGMAGAVALGAAADQTTVVDNAYIRVTNTADFCNSAGARASEVNRVVVHLSDCEIRLPDAAGKMADRRRKYGDVDFIPANKRPCEGPVQSLCRAVVVDIKRSNKWTPVAAGLYDPRAVDPAHYSVVLENPEVRVIRAHLGSGESSAMHQHARDRLTVMLTDADLRPTTAEGETRVLQGKAEDVTWVPGGPTRHTERNAASKPFEVIAIEIKNR